MALGNKKTQFWAVLTPCMPMRSRKRRIREVRWSQPSNNRVPFDLALPMAAKGGCEAGPGFLPRAFLRALGGEPISSVSPLFIFSSRP